LRGGLANFQSFGAIPQGIRLAFRKANGYQTSLPDKMWHRNPEQLPEFLCNSEFLENDDLWVPETDSNEFFRYKAMPDVVETEQCPPELDQQDSQTGEVCGLLRKSWFGFWVCYK
jgi:hypothetical protein